MKHLLYITILMAMATGCDAQAVRGRLADMSVDGVNVLSGATAAWDQVGCCRAAARRCSIKDPACAADYCGGVRKMLVARYSGRESAFATRSASAATKASSFTASSFNTPGCCKSSEGAW